MLHRRAFLSLPAALAASDWPSFRGPDGSGVSAARGIPSAWDATSRKNVAWRTPLPGTGHSSPVIHAGRIYVTTAASIDPAKQGKAVSGGGIDAADDLVPHLFKVLALDAASGKIVWERTVHEGTPKIKRHLKASYANPTAATDGRLVAAFFGSEGLHVLNTNGTPVWKHDFGTLNVGLKNEPAVQWGFASSPVLFEDLVIVQCDTQDQDFIAAHDLRTGKQRWISRREEFPSWSTPVIYRGTAGPLLIASAPRSVRALDPRTGREVWNHTGDDTEVRVPAPVIAGDLVIISGGYPPGRRFFALDARTGKLAWNSPNGGPYTTTPVATREHLYICSDAGVLGCYALADGKRVYQQRLPKGGSFSASPVIAEDRLYLASEDGDVHIVRTGPEFAHLGTSSLPEGIWATPAPSGRSLYIRTTGAMYAVRTPA